MFKPLNVIDAYQEKLFKFLVNPFLRSATDSAVAAIATAIAIAVAAAIVEESVCWSYIFLFIWFSI